MFLDIIRDVTLNSSLDKVLMAHAKFKGEVIRSDGIKDSSFSFEVYLPRLYSAERLPYNRKISSTGLQTLYLYEVAHQYRRRI